MSTRFLFVILLFILLLNHAVPIVTSCLSCPASVNSRKDKSLRVMSQKFVMLFLVSNPRVVSLDMAAKILIGEDHVADQDKNKFKSEYRAWHIFCIQFYTAVIMVKPHAFVCLFLEHPLILTLMLFKQHTSNNTGAIQDFIYCLLQV